MKTFLLSFVLMASSTLTFAAEKLSAVGFESLTVPAGSFTNISNGPGAWNLNTSGSSWDIVSATHAIAPLGTSGNFMDLIGVNGYNSIRYDVSSLDTNSVYTLSFKAALPVGIVDPKPIYFALRSNLNLFGGLDWIIQPRQAVAIFNEETTSGTWPTNFIRTIAPPVWWSTNHWVTNTITFTPKTTTCTLEFHASGGPWDTCAVLLDNISVQGN